LIVELAIFSGRPDPRWELDGASVARLIDIHRSLGHRAGPAKEPPALGYRGFSYALDGVRWRAWNGAVDGGGQVLDDPERSVERLLLDRLPDEYVDVRARLAAEMGPR